MWEISIESMKMSPVQRKLLSLVSLFYKFIQKFTVSIKLCTMLFL